MPLGVAASSSSIPGAAGADDVSAELWMIGGSMALLVVIHALGVWTRLPCRVLVPAPPLVWWATALGWSTLGVFAPLVAPTSEETRQVVDSHEGGTAVLAAIRAGVSEEAILLAMVVCVGLFLASAIPESAKFRTTATGLIVVSAVGASAVFRALPHAYQGGVHMLCHGVVGLLLAGLFVWCRSVVPMVVVHALYDTVVFTISGSAQVMVLRTALVVSSLAVVVCLVNRYRHSAARGMP